jgi:antitoxin component YwqK of YwqJK toxin-antitoxin module
MSGETTIIKERINSNWISYTYYLNKRFINRVHYSDGVFRCVDKLYYNGSLTYHYSYLPNTDILDGEIIAYE